MADTSERYALPLLQSGQAQKEVTHNSALARIDAFLHLAVESRVATAPPATPPEPGAWIVAAGATGTWAGHDGALALLDAAGWSFAVPRDGCVAFVRDEGVFAVRAGGVWRSDAWPVRGLAIGGRTLLASVPVTVAPASGGIVIDVEARAAIAALTAAMRAMGLVAG